VGVNPADGFRVVWVLLSVTGTGDPTVVPPLQSFGGVGLGPNTLNVIVPPGAWDWRRFSVELIEVFAINVFVVSLLGADTVVVVPLRFQVTVTCPVPECTPSLIVALPRLVAA
jgi:hypothetical protein